MANTVFWDQPVIKATLSTDTAASILAVASDGSVVKRPAIDTSTFMSSALTSAHIFVGNGSNVAADVAVTGDVTISNAGVTAIAAGVIVNADINSSAAIAVSKLAAQTASRVATFDSSGFLAPSSVTDTTLGYLDATSSIQTQLNARLSATITSPATGDILRYHGGAWVNMAVGTDGQFLKLVSGEPEWSTLTPPSIPTGGTTGQYLNKIDGTDYNTQWSTLTLDKITDVTATYAEVNLLDGVTASTAEINYLVGLSGIIQDQLDAKEDTITGGASTIVSSNLTADVVLVSSAGGKVGASAISTTTLSYLDATSSIQTQLDAKLSTALAQNNLFVGNSSGVASALSAGTSGYVLTSSSGVPTWLAPTGVLSGLTATRVPFAASANTLSDSSTFTFNSTTKELNVNGARIWTDHSTNGKDNHFFGINAGNTSVSGIDNLAFGPGALLGITSGDGNLCMGNTAGYLITSGGYNIIQGFQAGASITTASGNIITGGVAGGLVTGAYNIITGYSSGDALTSGSYNVIVGYNIDAQSATADGQLTIQNALLGKGNDDGVDTTLSTGILAHYSTAAQGSWSKATFIGNAAAEDTAITDGIVVYAKDSSDGSANSTLALYTEQGVESIGTYTPSHKLKVWINGTEYWIQLDAV